MIMKVLLLVAVVFHLVVALSPKLFVVAKGSSQKKRKEKKSECQDDAAVY